MHGVGESNSVLVYRPNTTAGHSTVGDFEKDYRER
jgi:hypothetical protein